MDERRFQVKLRDVTGINIGITVAEFIVIAESAPEAEMYVRQYMEPSRDFPAGTLHCSPWEVCTRELSS